MKDIVVYNKHTKELVVLLYDVNEDFKSVIGDEYAIATVQPNDYDILDIDGKLYFENNNDKLLYLDEYRGRYGE